MSSGTMGTAARLAGGAELSPPGRLAMSDNTTFTVEMRRKNTDNHVVVKKATKLAFVRLVCDLAVARNGV